MGKKINANKLVSTLNMTRDEWLERRKSGLGGSDVAVAAGVSPFKGQYDLFLEKTGRHEKPIKPEHLERMEFGNIMEPVIADYFASRNKNLKVERRNCIFQHPVTQWALCNVDRVLYDSGDNSWGVLECKNVGEWAYKLGDWDNNSIPFYYMCQMQHMLYVLDLDWGFFAYFIGGNRYEQQYIKRDDELIADLEKSCGNFWSLVEAGIEPPVDALCASSLAEMYPQREEHPGVDLSLEIDVLRELKIAGEEKKRAEDAYTLACNKVKRVMEGASVGFLGKNKVISWKESTQNRLDTSRLKKELPDIASQYMTQTTTRMFKPNWKGLEI